MDMNQYLEIFIDESKEHLQMMNEILLALEGDPDNLSHLGEIFRVAHTLKGMSGTMGFHKIMSLTHKMENLLDLIRNGSIQVNSGIIDILFECFDALEAYIENLEKFRVEGDLDSTELVNKLARIAEAKGDASAYAEKRTATQPVTQPATQSAPAAAANSGFGLQYVDLMDMITAAQDQGLSAHLVRVHLDPKSMLKAARAFIVFSTLENFGEILRSNPSAEDIEDERFENSFEILYLSKMNGDVIKAELMKVSEIESVETQLLERIETPRQAPDVEIDLQTIAPQPNAPRSEAEREPKDKDKEKDKDKNKTAKTVRVEISRLDNLMNLVSELIIVKTRLEDLESNKGSRADMNESIEYLERITTSLHNAVMKVRMVPVERTFNRFPRLVRDLSRDLGKNIRLFMSGEDTEVDRTVIDEIGDPLIHLIRNSLDHGIEMPEDREKSGKPEQGFVALRAYPDGNTVVIEVEDDGKGIDPEKIKSIAVRKQLISQPEGDQMSDQELIQLLFRPGFSTAEAVTDLSGRGVGLDVVKSKIEAINGTVEVTSSLGSGSKFVIRLPLTLAIIQALMVHLGDEKLAIPLNSIKEITSIQEQSITLVQNQEVVLYRNKTLPILRLRTVLNVPGEHPASDELITVIVKKGDQEAGLIVDRLIGQQEIVIKSLGKYLTGIKAIAGATILGNGSVALIVDPNQLI